MASKAIEIKNVYRKRGKIRENVVANFLSRTVIIDVLHLVLRLVLHLVLHLACS